MCKLCARFGDLPGGERQVAPVCAVVKSEGVLVCFRENGCNIRFAMPGKRGCQKDIDEAVHGCFGSIFLVAEWMA